MPIAIITLLVVLNNPLLQARLAALAGVSEEAAHLKAVRKYTVRSRRTATQG